MLRLSRTTLALAAVALILPRVSAAQDASKAISGGGIAVQGWTGKIDAKEIAAGLTLESAKFEKVGNTLHVVTGPAVTYWNPANKASGNYTVKATFKEAQFMGLNNHAHPYGIMIGGNDLGSDKETYFYCAAYGDGRFIARGFGPAPFQLNGRMGEQNAAIHKAAAKNEPVEQEIAVSVKGDKVECSVNGTVVGSYDKAAVVGEGKLKSTDGIYGLRFGHNTEAVVTGLSLTKN
jgi:hypothetical protein